MTCGLIPEQYCTLASHKLEVAWFHLAEFEKLIDGEIAALAADDPAVRYAPFHAHADGAIFESFASFDTYGCAVGHKFEVPNADRASFKSVGDRPEVPPAIAQRIAATVATNEWRRLEALRNLAGHRGVVSESMRWGQHLKGGFQVHLPDGDEALPVMTHLLRWTGEQIDSLYVGVCERERSILRERRQAREQPDVEP